MYIPDPKLLAGTLYSPGHEHDACGVGMVVDIKGRKSNQIVRQALTVLVNMKHRGALGSEPNTGDGAGILMQIPDAFLARQLRRRGLRVAGAGRVTASAWSFCRPMRLGARHVRPVWRRSSAPKGRRVLGWRTVPTDDSTLGATARCCRAVVRQVFIGKGDGLPRSPEQTDEVAFERKLFVIRRLAEKGDPVRRRDGGDEDFYIPSLSCQTIVYKGMLTAVQVEEFYPDLHDPAMASADRARPFPLQHQHLPQLGAGAAVPLHDAQRRDQHDPRQSELDEQPGSSVFKSELFGDDLQRVLPVIAPTAAIPPCSTTRWSS